VVVAESTCKLVGSLFELEDLDAQYQALRQHCDTVRQDLVVTLRRSKTDQSGAGRKIGMAHALADVLPIQTLGRGLIKAQP
jgi:hypothetical protein